MAKQIPKHNPAFMTPDELVQSFVVRKNELETIVQVVRENTTQSNQHVLVIGPRGIGKTMLALRVAEEIRRDAKLSQKWHPLVFAEESYTVTSPGEFWLEALFHLQHKTGDENLKRTYDELNEEFYKTYDQQRLHDRALAQLMDFADSHKKRLMLVVENFNMLVGDQLTDSDAWVLRKTLLHEPRIMLLATATSRFEQIDNSDKAMFELFRPIALKPLDQQQCADLWNSFSEIHVTAEQIRPLQILTGGSPRLLRIASSFAGQMSLKELMGQLMQLVDDHTDYFKSHLDNLPTIERKVYLALAEIWDPATARQIAQAARVNVNKASSLLRRLIDRGAVIQLDDTGRTKYYQIAERMYNIYYLMRRRGEPSSRVKAVVNFMVSFYKPDELLQVVKSITQEACELDSEAHADHFAAYEEILKRISEPKFCIKVLKATHKAFFDMPDLPESTRNLISTKKQSEDTEMKKKISALIKEAEALEIEALRPKGNHKKFKQAEECLKKAIKIAPNDPLPWSSLGSLLSQNNKRFIEAEKALRKALTLSPNEEDTMWIWLSLGVLLHMGLKRHKESDEAYCTALELCYKQTQYIAMKIKDDETKEPSELLNISYKALQSESDLTKSYAELMLNLLSIIAFITSLRGQIAYQEMKSFDRAKEILQESLSYDPKELYALPYLISLLLEQDERPDEAIELLQDQIAKPLSTTSNAIINYTKACILLASTGHAEKVLEIIQNSPKVQLFESLITGLQIYLGQDVKAAAEIVEVGKDVAKRIEQQQGQMQALRAARDADTKK